MKRNIIYALAGCVMALFSACSDSYEDATGKHVYGENENPYLRVDMEAAVTKNIEFAVGHFEPYVIHLNDYNDLFQKKMGMTVDQVVSGLSDGSVVFHNINTTRNIWDKSEKTKGGNGWYYNSVGTAVNASDGALFSAEIDTNAKTLLLQAEEGTPVGTLLTVNVGFAVNGPDYDRFVRFVNNLSVVDPSTIMVSVSIPEGDYASTGIDFTKYAETINVCMGMSVEEFLANLDYDGDSGEKTDGSIHMYIINTETGEWDATSSYTAESPGYWLNDKGAPCAWGTDGYSLFANTKNKDKVLYIGRAPELAAGSKYTISVGYKDTKNEKNFFRFIITATLE